MVVKIVYTTESAHYLMWPNIVSWVSMVQGVHERVCKLFIVADPDPCWFSLFCGSGSSVMLLFLRIQVLAAPLCSPEAKLCKYCNTIVGVHLKRYFHVGSQVRTNRRNVFQNFPVYLWVKYLTPKFCYWKYISFTLCCFFLENQHSDVAGTLELDPY